MDSALKPNNLDDPLCGYELRHVIPNQDRQLAYAIVVPKECRSIQHFSDQTENPGQLMRIGLFADRNQSKAVALQVFMSRMPCEVDLKDWLMLQATRFRARLTSVEPSTRHNGSQALTAEGTSGEGQQTQLSRLTALVDSGRIFLFVASASPERYAAESQTITIASESFELLEPVGTSRMEAWKKNRSQAPDFVVAYPASWSSRRGAASMRGKSSLDLQLMREEKLQAYVRVKATDPAAALSFNPDPAAELKLLQDELASASIRCTSAWQSITEPSWRAIDGVKQRWIAEGTLAGRRLDLRFGDVWRQGLLFSVLGISIPYERNPLLSMRSKRAYDIALATAARIIANEGDSDDHALF